MFGGLIVLNQRRSADEREPGPEQNFTKSLCEGAPKHRSIRSLCKGLPNMFMANSFNYFSH